MNTFHLRVIKPEKVVYEAEVISLSLPTSSGQVTVLANHEPMVMRVVTGEMVVRSLGDGGKEKEEPMAVAGGTVEIKKDEVVVLANRAEHVHELDIEKAKEARTRIEGEIEKIKSDHASYEGLLQQLHKEHNRIKMYEKYRS